MGQSTFYRQKKEKNYTVIDNTFIKDKSLSAKAKGLMCYLLSLPEDWRIYLSELQNNFTDGKDSIRSGIKELEKNGYLKKQILHDNKGKFNGYHYEVIEIPSLKPFLENPKTDNPYTEKPKTDNPQLLNTNIIQSTNIQNTNIEHLKEKLWNLYPNKKGKSIAFKKLNNILKKYTFEEIERCVYRYSKEVKGKDKQYIQHGSTFFNGTYIDYLDSNYAKDIKNNTKDKVIDPVIL
ncbi:helix-turn-helix domain-containing protein [Clostridium botulinum]|uniref:Phage replication protein n=1 Tax=Clostridium botulinum CFSAN001627 TaxID=1232189 RepID=M1ZT03_CLOBO|nr:helix-turn-helix domain-containing protein [Clostridium botulinum]EKN42937.1 phage replication protein [Clostridium botulinum CFSAN001627]MBY6850411.1 helix-turn-helix domain-containing protein [Clostridium botulinum]MBY6857471.1 helix-turn-helix domain-containing protein [Clostridium botulinum]MBY6967337.1 helix-turn-helix domain-containing protein [Clostridium botulinum]NFC90774.1 helix-turn-helix domain-containing protein [Clostridium botulinum]